MAKDTMTYLAKPADTRGAPVKGFRDDSTVDWILCKVRPPKTNTCIRVLDVAPATRSRPQQGGS